MYLRITILTLMTLLFAHQALSALVVTCPTDKNENFEPGCGFAIGDYTGEVVILESDGMTFINQVQVPGTVINQTTTIQIIVTDEGGNVESCYFNIILPPLPEVTLSSTEPFCYGDAGGSVTANVTGGQAPYTYLWTTGETGASISGLTAGSYGVIVTDANDCPVLRETTVTEPPRVVLDLNVLVLSGGHNVSSKDAEDGEASVTATGGTPPYVWLWSTGETTSSVSGLGVGEYWVMVTDFNGCVDTASFQLVAPFIINVPVAISPNGDGLNDTFVIAGIEDHPENSLLIFNRRGDIVYQAENYANDWDGTANADMQIGSSELPDGSYFYHLQIKDHPEVIRGSVLIKRK